MLISCQLSSVLKAQPLPCLTETSRHPSAFQNMEAQKLLMPSNFQWTPWKMCIFWEHGTIYLTESVHNRLLSLTEILPKCKDIPLKDLCDACSLCTSSSSAFPALSLGFTILGEIFVYVTIFNPTIEVVTFCPHEWCMLGVFLLPAVTCLGYECPCDGMHVCTD